MQLFSRKNTQGFTLIELLVVVSVIGILAAVLLANFVGVRGRAGDSVKKNNLRQLKTALRLYYNDYQTYPDESGALFAGCGAAGTSGCSAGGVFSAGSPATVYMNEIPIGVSYYSDGVNEFLLRVQLENLSDAEIEASQDQCDVGSRSYYGGTPTSADFFMCED